MSRSTSMPKSRWNGSNLRAQTDLSDSCTKTDGGTLPSALYPSLRGQLQYKCLLQGGFSSFLHITNNHGLLQCVFLMWMSCNPTGSNFLVIRWWIRIIILRKLWTCTQPHYSSCMLQKCVFKAFVVFIPKVCDDDKRSQRRVLWHGTHICLFFCSLWIPHWE